MPDLYTPTTPTLTLCEALVTVLTAAWNPVAPDAVEWCFFKRITDEGTRKLLGRQVYLFPTDYDNAPETRGEDVYTHRITALVVERYPETDAGDPTRDWIAERVDFVHTQIVQGLDWSHDGPPAFNGKLLTLSADVVVVDIEQLTTQRMFYSSVELVFSEVIDA